MSGSDDGISAIKIAVAILVMIGVISLVLIIYYFGRNTANESLESANKIASDLADADKKVYDGANVAGTEVLNAINRFSDEDFGIKVVTKKNSGTWYNKTVSASGELSSASGSLASAKNISSNTYINPSGLFTGELIKDENKVVVGVIFTQK